MSSVPLQFLIHILPQVKCSSKPLILPLSVLEYREATIGIERNFTIYALNSCDPSDANITDIIVSSGVPDIVMENVKISSANASITFTWKPHHSLIGIRQICVTAYTR